MPTHDVFERSRRVTHDRIYKAGFSQGYTGKLTRRHYASPLDHAAWARGLGDGIAESKLNGEAIADSMARGRRPRVAMQSPDSDDGRAITPRRSPTEAAAPGLWPRLRPHFVVRRRARPAQRGVGPDQD
jgi:hypothetical protein